MGRLLNNIDKILDDDFFDELIHLDIDSNDCSPKLNDFLDLQSKQLQCSNKSNAYMNNSNKD